MAEMKKKVSENHPELFHYTTLEAFQKIYTSQVFWATSYEHMNDGSELTRFRVKIAEFIEPKITELVHEHMQLNPNVAGVLQKYGGLAAAVSSETSMFMKLLHETTFGEDGLQAAFICSFCGHSPKSYEAEHGLLSQWRGYGTGGGVCIVLNTKGIEALLRKEKEVFAHPVNHIGDVTYDNDPELAVKPEFRKVFDRFPDMLRRLYERSNPSFEEIFSEFVIGSTLVKHHGFYEEKEVRIVVCPTPSNPSSLFYVKQGNHKSIKSRKSGDREIKYIELFGKEPLPITRVIVGPSRLQDRSCDLLSRILADSGIEVRKSETPYIG